MLRKTRTTVLVFAASYALAALLASAAQATVWPLTTAYSRGSVMYSTANWNALKATIEVLNPSLSAADYNNGGYLRERIKVNRNNQNADIRLGYSKEKWYGVSTYLSAYFEYALLTIASLTQHSTTTYRWAHRMSSFGVTTVSTGYRMYLEAMVAWGLYTLHSESCRGAAPTSSRLAL
jgi:opacity protein-like surface antigen